MSRRVSQAGIQQDLIITDARSEMKEAYWWFEHSHYHDRLKDGFDTLLNALKPLESEKEPKKKSIAKVDTALISAIRDQIT